VRNWLVSESGAMANPFMNNAFLLKLLRMAAVALLLAAGNQISSVSAKSGRSATSLDTARSAYDFVNSIGVNLHLNYFDTAYGNFPLVERELKSIGIRHVRDGVHLQNADYNEAVYKRWIGLGTIGVRFDAVVDLRSKLGPVTSDLLDQVDRLAGRTIESFEGPNELDISNLPDWPAADRDYQQILFKSTRSMASREPIKVIGPSMASASKGAQIGNVTNSIDEGNLHPYPAGKMPSVVFPLEVDRARRMSEDKPIIVTESGYHNALNDHSDQPAVSESAAAKYIPRLFLENYAHGIARTYLYEFLDETSDPGLTHFQQHWGLIRADGSEKPAFSALKNLIAELSDGASPAHLQQLAWSLSASTEQTHHLLLQKSSGEFDLVIWQEASSYDSRSQTDIVNAPLGSVLTLNAKASSITLYEPSLQAQPLRVYTNVTSVPLELPDHPLVVKIVLK
jgi:hypothetical protein